MDRTVDLLDTRGRVVRLLVAALLGAVVAYVLFGVVRSVAASPNPDPMSKLSGLVLGGGLFLAVTAIANGVLGRVARRRS